MSIQFQSLFTIQVLHDYYSSHEKRCGDFAIVPTEDCALLMKNIQVLHKSYNNKLLTVVNAEKEPNDTPPPDFKLFPFPGFQKDMVLRYYLLLKNPYFSNFTAMALKLSEKKRYYFSNLSKNTTGSILSLSNIIIPFSISSIYETGSLVKGPDNKVYQAIRNSDGTLASKDLTDINYWQQAPEVNPYVSSEDEITLTGGTYNYKLKTSAANIIIKIFSIDKTNDSLPFDNLIETVEKIFPVSQETVIVDLSKRSPGKYKLIVNSEDPVWLYVDAVALRQNIIGIIEIHHFEKVPADFQLLTALGHIKIPEPVFTIWFKNRLVIWKYISQNGDIGVTDSGVPALNFIPASGATVKSEKAIALTEKPITTLIAARSAPGTGSVKNLKNPDIEKLVFEKEGGTGFFAGNMYVKIDI